MMIEIFLKTVHGANASGMFDPASNKVTLNKGSILTIDPIAKVASNIKQNYSTAAQALRGKKLKKLGATSYEVLKDIQDLSPSAASVIVTGKAGSGWNKWTTEDGRLLNALRPRQSALIRPAKISKQKAARHTTTRSASPPPSIPSPPKLPTHPTCDDLIKAVVQWIQASPFVREYRTAGTVKPVPGAAIDGGWDFRIQEYAYAKSRLVSFPCVYAHTTPVLSRLATIVARYHWPTVSSIRAIAPADLRQLEKDAQWICNTWGGVPKASFARTWEVVKSAVTGVRHGTAPMDSGWTKVASFATDGLPNSQTIWDSRISTSLIWRIDQLLHINPHLSRISFPCLANLQIVPGRFGSGTRPRHLHLSWPLGPSWSAHYAGSDIVRRMVTILNNPLNGFPGMPQPSGVSKKWDVFGVSLVLFMDGY